MSFDRTDVGSHARRISEIFYDQALGDILASASVPEPEGTLLTTEDQLSDNAKYGDCYIFDYQNYQDKAESRLGSEKDVKRLSHDFDALDFNVYSKNLDLSKQQTLDILKKAAKNVPRQSKCFVCCFLTHGDNGILKMKDAYLKIEEILKCFSRSACKNLEGIPKIFIFQACRGCCCEGPVYCDSTDSGSKTDIPDYLDFLLVYSTYEGNKAFKTRDEECLENNHGSFFIDELCRTLEEFSEDSDLLEILTIVNYRMAHFYLSHTIEKETNNKKQMPNFTSRLRTEVKFNKRIPKFSTSDTKYFDDRRSIMSSLGSRSTTDPLKDKQIYSIQNSGIKLLFLSNLEKNFGDNLCSSIAAEKLHDWSKKELTDSLKAQDCSKSDCLVCFVACKAKGDYLCDNEGSKFAKQTIVELFTGKACKDLIEKPKIFIFLMFSPPKKSRWPLCVLADSTDGNIYNTIPVHSDILEVAITVQELEQLQGVMKKFCNVFESESSEDFISQLTKMNDELVKDHKFYSLSNKSLATFSLNSTLTETLILNKPKFQRK